MAKVAMKYKGNGFYVGVPARDLSAEEVEQYGKAFLLALGLYEEVKPPKPKRVYKPAPVEDEPSEDEE
jgi:hypothetical protein